ncbi:MAG: hypothetical protein KJ709_00075 [Nanoarchaeota archaeon]|nr:hypothetical protein [Nanoarchaeota archaeon]
MELDHLMILFREPRHFIYFEEVARRTDELDLEFGAGDATIESQIPERLELFTRLYGLSRIMEEEDFDEVVDRGHGLLDTIASETETESLDNIGLEPYYKLLNEMYFGPKPTDKMVRMVTEVEKYFAKPTTTDEAERHRVNLLSALEKDTHSDNPDEATLAGAYHRIVTARGMRPSDEVLCEVFNLADSVLGNPLPKNPRLGYQHPRGGMTWTISPN